MRLLAGQAVELEHADALAGGAALRRSGTRRSKRPKRKPGTARGDAPDRGLELGRAELVRVEEGGAARVRAERTDDDLVRRLRPARRRRARRAPRAARRPIATCRSCASTRCSRSCTPSPTTVGELLAADRRHAAALLAGRVHPGHAELHAAHVLLREQLAGVVEQIGAKASSKRRVRRAPPCRARRGRASTQPGSRAPPTVIQAASASKPARARRPRCRPRRRSDAAAAPRRAA